MAISRRKFVLGAMTVPATWLGWSGMPAWGLPAPAARPIPVEQFMQLSALLVNHRLDAAIGALDKREGWIDTVKRASWGTAS